MNKTQHPETRYDAIISSPVGPLGLKLIAGNLSTLHFLPEVKITKEPTEKSLEAITQELAAYFTNPRHHFQLPLELQGTPFQQAVWAALQQIPSGETRSYQALAQKLKTSPRAIGNACRANPLPIIIPCHRVLAKGGMGGYCGKTGGELIAIKQQLLSHENPTQP